MVTGHQQAQCSPTNFDMNCSGFLWVQYHDKHWHFSVPEFSVRYSLCGWTFICNSIRYARSWWNEWIENVNSSLWIFHCVIWHQDTIFTYFRSVASRIYMDVIMYNIFIAIGQYRQHVLYTRLLQYTHHTMSHFTSNELMHYHIIKHEYFELHSWLPKRNYAWH